MTEQGARSPEAWREDLAFMRGIVAAGEETMRPLGAAYFAAGLCYGIQCLLSGMRMLEWIGGGGEVDLAIGVLPTVIFLLILTLLIVRDRGSGRVETSTGRAIGLVFGCVGLTNLALVAAIGIVAWRQQSITTWLIYPIVVMILQGMAWLFAYMLRLRAWLAAIAAGWFATGIGMAVALAAESAGWYVIIVSIGLFAFMAAPGAYLMRADRPRP